MSGLIETERLCLIPLSQDHAPIVLHYRQMPEIYIWTWDDLSTAAEYIAQATSHATSLNYLITGPPALLSGPRSTRPYKSVAASIQLPEPPTGTSPPTIAAPTRASTVAGKAGEEDAPWLAFGTIGTVRDGEVGYMIHPAAAGLGVATEALRAFGPAYFAQFPQQTEVQAIASVRNPASGRVLEKAGFVRLDGVPVEGDDAGDAVVWALDAATLEKRVR